MLQRRGTQEALAIEPRVIGGKYRAQLKSWQFWSPLIALYSGARLGEITQLTTENIVQEDGIWLIVITDAGDDQAVKTRAAVRKVPVSEKLTELGFIEYAKALRVKGQLRLFGDLPGRSPATERNKLSRWFGETYKARCGIQNDPTGARKVVNRARWLRQERVQAVAT